MLCRFFSLVWSLPLFSAAATVSSAVLLAASGQTVVYPIESNERGTEIVNTFNSLSHASGTNVPEVALQTTIPNGIPYTTYKYLNNGIVPYVQAITQTTYNTLLIVTYLSTLAPGQPQVIVIPVEYMIAFLYFPLQNNLPTSPAPFVSGTISGTLPFYWVDPQQRAADIASAVTTLMKAPFKTSSQTQIWMQVTLTGPFNPPVPNGLLKNVTGITVNNSLIQIQFLPPNQATTLTIIVGPEQVQQITYIQNVNYP